MGLTLNEKTTQNMGLIDEKWPTDRTDDMAR